MVSRLACKTAYFNTRVRINIYQPRPHICHVKNNLQKQTQEVCTELAKERNCRSLSLSPPYPEQNASHRLPAAMRALVLAAVLVCCSAIQKGGSAFRGNARVFRADNPKSRAVHLPLYIVQCTDFEINIKERLP